MRRIISHLSGEHQFFAALALALAAGLMAMLFVAQAFGQTSPNLVRGQVLTADQWNQLFINKRDYNPNIPACPWSPCPTGSVVLAPNSVIVTDSTGTVVVSQSALPSGITIPAPVFPGPIRPPAVQTTLPITTAWQFDASSQAPQVVANGGSLPLAAGTGLLALRNLANGDVGLYNCGTTCTLVSSSGGTWSPPTTTPVAGTLSLTISGGVPTVFSNYGTSTTLSGALTRVN